MYDQVVLCSSRLSAELANFLKLSRMAGSGRSRRYGAGCRSNESRQNALKEMLSIPLMPCISKAKQSKGGFGARVQQSSPGLLLLIALMQQTAECQLQHPNERTLMWFHSEDCVHPGLWMCWLQGRAVKGSILVLVFRNFTPFQILRIVALPSKLEDLQPARICNHTWEIEVSFSRLFLSFTFAIFD